MLTCIVTSAPITEPAIMILQFMLPEDFLYSTCLNYTYLDVNNPFNWYPRDSSPMARRNSVLHEYILRC